MTARRRGAVWWLGAVDPGLHSPGIALLRMSGLYGTLPALILCESPRPLPGTPSAVGDFLRVRLLAAADADASALAGEPVTVTRITVIAEWPSTRPAHTAQTAAVDVLREVALAACAGQTARKIAPSAWKGTCPKETTQRRIRAHGGSVLASGWQDKIPAEGSPGYADALDALGIALVGGGILRRGCV